MPEPVNEEGRPLDKGGPLTSDITPSTGEPHDTAEASLDGAPVLRAEQTKGGGLRAWCPFCELYHHHGSGSGHRVAHCRDARSPYKRTGYVLAGGDS